MNSWEMLAHAAAVLSMLSYLVRDILPLRILAIASLSCALLYDYIEADYINEFWGAVFIVINAAQVGILVTERRRVRFNEEEKLIHSKFFPQLKPIEFYRILQRSVMIEAAEGEFLTKQNEPVLRLMLLVEGAVDVQINGETAVFLTPGNFIGEMSFISGDPATATCRTIAKTRYLMWTHDDLRGMLKKHPEMETPLRTVLSINIVEKLTHLSN